MMQKKERIASGVIWCCYLLVLVAISGRTWALRVDDASMSSGLFYIALKLLPLIVFLPALFSRSMKGLAGLSMVALFYFCFVVVALFQDPVLGAGWLWLELAAIWGLFLGVIMNARAQR